MSLALVAALCFAKAGLAADVAGAPIRRVILALYDSQTEKEPGLTRIHRYAETPLNYLGLTVIYHDVQSPLPPLEAAPDVRGILTWFSGPVREPQAAYVRWATASVNGGRYFVILGDPGFKLDLGTPDETKLGEKLTTQLGFIGSGRYSPGPYDIRVLHKVPSMVEYERLLAGPLPGYVGYRSTGSQTRTYLSVRLGDDPESRSDLVVVSPRGGLAAAGYEIYNNPWLGYAQWRIDPFAFFRSAFRTDELPKPDPWSLAGRRVFYAHVDGDGWREHTRIPGYKTKVALCAEVVLENVLKRYPHTPITVAPIVADLDERRPDGDRARAIAEEVFSLPNVEVGSHTNSHPYLWERFKNHADVARSDPELSQEQTNVEGSPAATSSSERARQLIELGTSMPPPYRAYSDTPFDVDSEVQSSIEALNRLLAPSKRVAIFEWSGDTHPFEDALAAVHGAGIPNINGGSSGYYDPYMSVTSISPIGLKVGNYFQVYGGNGAEKSYTNKQPDRVAGSRHFNNVLQRTESPRRIRPFEVYWHMYSALHYSSLNSIIAQLDSAQDQELVSVPTSTYARMANGFVSSKLSKVGDRAWRIENRSDLATIRFDDAVSSEIDFALSHGVVGQRHYQGSLYVYLDAADPAPVVALRTAEASEAGAEAPRPYLVQSHWPVRDLAIDNAGFEFAVHGYGAGDMLWHVSEPGEYQAASLDEGRDWRETVVVGNDGLLHLMPPADVSWSRIRIQKRTTQKAASL